MLAVLPVCISSLFLLLNMPSGGCLFFFFYTYPVETPSGGIGGLVICMISGSCVVLQLFLCYLFQFRLII